jgi:amphi-Trp domain-containing protein
MGREIKLFKSEEKKSRSEISAFLRQIADRLDQGRVTLCQAETELILDIPGTAILEVQVEEEHKANRGIQRSLELEIKWGDGPGDSGLQLG